MSSALVRQALDFVDPDESVGKRKKRVAGRRERSPGQELKLPVQKPQSKSKNNKTKEQQVTKALVNQLLELSKPTIHSSIAGKIVERAVKGKPLADKIEVNTEEEKSILFPNESFDQFEEELFCS